MDLLRNRKREVYITVSRQLQEAVPPVLPCRESLSPVLVLSREKCGLEVTLSWLYT